MRVLVSFLKNSKGFTLIELMTATFVTVLFSAAFFAAFYVMRNELYQQNNFSISNRAARFALDAIARDVKEAIAIVPTRGGDTTGDQVLILQLPSVNDSGDATNIAADFDYVVYKMDSVVTTNLIRNLDVLGGTSLRNGGADSTGKIIARSVNGLTFATTGGIGLGSVAGVSSLASINAQITARGTTLLSTQTQTTALDSDLKIRNKGAL